MPVVELKQAGFKNKLLFLVMALFLSMFLTVFMATPAKAASGATLIVTTPTISFGNSIGISGTGFDPGEKIAIWVTSPRGKAFDSGYLNASADGTFNNFTNTDYYVVSSPGTWHVTVQGITSGKQAVDSFTVRTPTFGAQAVAVEGLVLIAFSGHYFFPGEQITAWVTDGKGNVVGFGNYVGYAASDGSIPADPKPILIFGGTPGTYHLTLQSLTSNIRFVTTVKA